MSVNNGQQANAATFNNAFASKTDDNTITGVQTLNNTSNTSSGAQIDNLQRTVNGNIQNGRIFIYIQNDSDASWNVSDLVLNDDLKISLPETGFENTVSAATITIADGEHVYVVIDRTSNATISTSISSTMPSVSNGQDVIRLVSRKGDSLIWFDNTYQEDASTIKIGQGGSGTGAYQEKVGTANGVNQNFPLAFVPVNDQSILVFSNTVNFLTTDWIYNSSSNQIEFVSAPAAGVDVYVYYLTSGATITPPSPSGVKQVEYRTLTVGEVAAKQLTLSATPAEATKVIVDIIGGTSQHYSIDYTVSSNDLIWNGLGMDGILSSGDVLRIFYFS